MKFIASLEIALWALLAAVGVRTAEGAAPFRVVAYAASWQGNVNAIQYGKLTNINYAFLSPNADGSLQAIDGPSTLQSLVSLAHAAKVQVSISIAGNPVSSLVTIAASPSLTTTFVNNVMSFVSQYNLDGVDMDWEFPTTGTQATNYQTMMAALATALHAQGKTLTAAVIANGGDSILSGVFSSVDWLNIMNYDNTNGVGQSTFQAAISDYGYWVGTRGLPAAKAVMGIPFYGNPSQSSYATLLSLGASPYSDAFTDSSGTAQGYNGIPTVQQKTNLAFNEKGGGVMIWTIADDTTDANSLLSAIDDTVQANDIPVGRIISLQAGINSLWVSATNGGAGSLIASAATPGTAESFLVVDESPTFGTGYVALRSLTNGLYVSTGAGGNSSLTANKATVTSTEAFFWEPDGFGTAAGTNNVEVNLQATNGLWVSATAAGASPLVANAPNPKSWETYFLKLWAGDNIEAEGLAVQSSTAGDAEGIVNNASFSGGAGMQLTAMAVGDQVTFLVPNIEAGSYDLRVGVEENNNCGAWQLAIGPAGGTFTNVNGPQDTYAASPTFTTIDLGTWTPGTTSSKWFRFSVTGKNASSTGYTSIIDCLTLIPLRPIKYEAEVLPVTSASGVTAAAQSDTLASGAAWSLANTTAVGQSLTYSVGPSIAPAMAYDVVVGYKSYINRGVFQLAIDGVPQGPPVDEYASTASFASSDLGAFVPGTGGNHAFTFTCAGVNASSTSDNLAIDYVTLTPLTSTLYEVDALPETSTPGVTVATQTDPLATGGGWSLIGTTAPGQSATFTLGNIEASVAYDVVVGYKVNTNRGIFQLSVDGTSLGTPVDEYGSAAAYSSIDLGTFVFAASGNHSFTFTCVGADAASTSDQLAVVYITLTPPGNLKQQQWSSWLAQYGLAAGNAEPGASLAADGICTLWKYAGNLSPTQLDSKRVLAPRAALFNAGGVQYMQFSYLRRVDYAARGLSYAIQTSGNLASGIWTNAAATEIGTPVPTGDGVTETATLRLNAPIPGGTQKLFARMELTLSL